MHNQGNIDAAVEYFASGLNCAEATLLALTEALGIDADYAPRIATGFGAGMGRLGETCGAVTGAIMVLGLKFGRDNANDLHAKALTHQNVRELIAKFKEKFGSVRCIELTGCDMTTQEGLERAKSLDLHANLCPKYVAFVAEETLKLIDTWTKTN